MNDGDLKRILNSSYQKNKKAEKTLLKSGYKLDKNLSGERAKVFIDDNNQASIVYRGTANKSDVMTDLAIPFNALGQTKRLKHTKKIAQKVKDKYGGEVNAYGHSLGGILAERSGVGGNIITYNKASRGSNKGTRNKKQIDVRTTGDLVSVLTPHHERKKVIKSGTINPLDAHGMKQLGNKKIIFV